MNNRIAFSKTHQNNCINVTNHEPNNNTRELKKKKK